MMVSARTSLLAAVALVACASPQTNPPATSSPPRIESAEQVTTKEPAPAPSTTTAPAPAPAEKADTSGTPRELLMRSHFREAAQIRKAVIDGALSDAIAPAQALSHNDDLGKIDPSWQSSIDVLEFAAKRIQRSSDIPAAAAAIADIGIACGACHKVAGGPHPSPDAAPPADGTLTTRMRRHVWATERLWEGIYVPSDASWKAGVEALSGEPFPKEVLDRGDVHARSAASSFRSLVATAGSKKTPQERGQLYASLLETCSACHVVTRKK